MSSFGHALRAEFLLEPDTIFLNHGSFGAVPRAVYNAAVAWRQKAEANPDRFIRTILGDALRASATRLASALGRAVKISSSSTTRPRVLRP